MRALVQRPTPCGSPEPPRLQMTESMASTIVGSYGYMAPEQFRCAWQTRQALLQHPNLRLHRSLPNLASGLRGLRCLAPCRSSHARTLPRAAPIRAMPPRGAATPASDLYALGGTLLYLVSGQPPFAFPQERMRVAWADKVTVGPQLKGARGEWLSGGLS